ncbi:MAG: DNA primase small subunit domain-containing protein, partial [Candidatus Diapherotrites archaeon]|nr:DNA primase small subunit domain-containing protein [Candidatus Diapherotrites archaeon]
NECLGEVKNQMLRLLEFLENDLGISKGMSINFSGFKGYHLHIRDESVQNLSSSARIELVDYLTANNLDFFSAGFFKKEKAWVCPKKEEAMGWSKRTLEGIKNLFKNSTVTELAIASGTTVSIAKKLLEKKETVLADIDKGFLHSLSQQKKTDEFWKNILQGVVDSQKVDIDRQTSIDIAKILRVPNTIHGGTGLLAKEFPLSGLKEFQPLKDCVVFSQNPVKVFVERCPEFEMFGQKFPAMQKTEVELPEFAAVFLIAKCLARLP